MPTTAVEEVIRARVRDLLARRSDVSQAEFGRRIGRGYSWVSAFLTGKRHANEIHLLWRMAKFFGVTVGYLLGETDVRLQDPGAMTLLAAWERIHDPRDRHAVLQLALTLQQDDAAPVPQDDAPDASTLHSTPTGLQPQKRAR